MEGHGLHRVLLRDSNANVSQRGRALGLGTEENCRSNTLWVKICGAQKQACLLGLALGARISLRVVWDTLEQGVLLTHWKLLWLLLALLWRLLLLHGRALLLHL